MRFPDGPNKEQHQILYKFREKCDGDSAMIRPTFREERMSHTRKVQTHQTRKRRNMWRATSKAYSTISLIWKGLFTKHLSCQPIPHNNVTFYGDCIKMREDSAPKFWRQKNWMLYHDNAPSHTSFFTREFWTKNNMTVVLHPPTFLCSTDWK
jgi:hypothetical protein